MRVKLHTTMAGPDGCHRDGETVEYSEKVCKALIAGGFAERVDEPKSENVTITGLVPEPEPETITVGQDNVTTMTFDAAEQSAAKRTKPPKGRKK